MFHLQKSKWYYLIDVFINNFLYLGNIFTSDDHKIEIHIPYMYLTERQLCKANTSDIETSVFDFMLLA